MRYFFDEQGRTRVFARGVRLYVEGGNPRRTPSRAKRAIYGWTLMPGQPPINTQQFVRQFTDIGYDIVTHVSEKIIKLRV